jgi:predicted ATPase
MPGLVSPAELARLQRRVRGTTQESMLWEMVEALNVLTVVRPLVLMLEDLHWSDSSTLDLITMLARRREPARLLLLGTYRPPDALQRDHPLQTVAHELHLHGQCEELSLRLLPDAAVADYLAARFPEACLPAGLARLVHQRTEGNPLFMLTVVEDWVRRGWFVQVDGRWTLRVGLAALAVSVPEGLGQMLEQHLDRLSPLEQRVLEVGSVAVSTVSAAAMAAGLAQGVVQVEACCAGLARRQQWLEACGEQVWPDGTVAGGYRFAHTLSQEVAYTWLAAARRAQLHRRIGEREEAGYGPRGPERAAMLAVHFARGRDYHRALRYLQHAADNALRRCAYAEASTHLPHALTLLRMLPETPERAQRELDLLSALSPAVTAVKGHAAPEIERIATRAWELYQHLGARTPLVAMLPRVWGYHLLRAEVRAHEVAAQFLTLAQHHKDPALLLGAHYGLGVILYFLGACAPARTHLEQALACYDSQQHADPRTTGSARNYGVGSRAYAADVLWLLGYPDQAQRQSHEALTQAQALAHPFTLATALNRMSTLCQRAQDVQAVHARAEASIALSRAQGFPMWLA